MSCTPDHLSKRPLTVSCPNLIERLTIADYRLTLMFGRYVSNSPPIRSQQSKHLRTVWQILCAGLNHSMANTDTMRTNSRPTFTPRSDNNMDSKNSFEGPNNT